jgi:Tfp pilus assembly protein FimT
MRIPQWSLVSILHRRPFLWAEPKRGRTFWRSLSLRRKHASHRRDCVRQAGRTCLGGDAVLPARLRTLLKLPNIDGILHKEEPVNIAGEQNLASVKRATLRRAAPARRSIRGFSMIEAAVTVAIIMILAAAVVPMVQVAFRIYQLRSAVASVRGVIQATRYRAISDGYPYQIAFNSAAGTYQMASNPTFQSAPPGAFVNIDTAKPIAGSSVQATMSADTTFKFSPSGLVTVTTGANTFTLTLLGNTKTFTVSTYGNVNVN